ncbi:hypothetical protein OSTOST_15779 [Ostertagia ostertagi]
MRGLALVFAVVAVLLGFPGCLIRSTAEVTRIHLVDGRGSAEHLRELKKISVRISTTASRQGLLEISPCMYTERGSCFTSKMGVTLKCVLPYQKYLKHDLSFFFNTDSGFDVKSDLFSRPRAIAVVRIDGIDSLYSKSHPTYQLENDKFDPSSLDEELANLFGVDRETVNVNRDGSSGSEIAKIAAKQEIKDEIIKTKLPLLRQELEHVHRLAAAIASQGPKFDKSNAADIYRVTISGLAEKTLTAEDREVAVKDVQNAVNKLTQALKTAY